MICMHKNNSYFYVNLYFDLLDFVHVHIVTSSKHKIKQKFILCSSLDEANLLMFDLELTKQRTGFKYCSDNTIFSLVPQIANDIIEGV